MIASYAGILFLMCATTIATVAAAGTANASSTAAGAAY